MSKCRTCIYCKNDGLFYTVTHLESKEEEKLFYGNCHKKSPNIEKSRAVWPEVMIDSDFCGDHKEK